MKVKPFIRTRAEYNYSRIKSGYPVTNSGRFEFIEYNLKDEQYMRAKEAGRCYAAIGNIPMMLNKLYSAINFEGKNFKYHAK